MADQLEIRRDGNPAQDELTVVLDLAFERALKKQSCISQAALELPGMSGKLYRMFINNLVRMVPDARYLEVGSYAGSTACAAMDKNVAKIVCIDNWSQFGGPKDLFLANTDKHKTEWTDFRFLESDFRAVDAKSLGSFNVYLFDGPHDKQDQFDGLDLYKRALDKDSIFIVDDWNWAEVRDGTFEAIRGNKFEVEYSIEVRTTLDNTHTSVPGAAGEWHNGYFLGKLTQRG